MLTRIYIVLFIFLFASCNTEDNQSDMNSTISVPAPQPITFSIVAVLPHDTTAFTQGLQFYNGKLYEGTGEFKNSTLRIVDPTTGKVEKKYLIPDSTIFGEGITIFKNKIYQLTWESHKIFVYDIGNISKPIKTLNWPYKGWGITNDGNSLIISDGSDKLYYVLPDEEKNNMKQLKIISVADNTGSLDMINELEYIDGYVYANRWQTDDILKIDTSNGHVIGKMDLKGILAQYATYNMNLGSEVLNGIAYDSATKKLYITGKRWPKMFEIKLNH
jgi:glutamine cyclotransferase